MIDGHRRLEAIRLLAATDPDVLLQEYPVLIVVEETIEDAKNTLLQISSQYGKITGKGLQGFIAGCPKIKLESTNIKVKLPKPRLPAQAKLPGETSTDTAIIKLRCPKNKLDALKAVLEQCSFVEVL